MKGLSIRWRKRYGVLLLTLIAFLSGWWLRQTDPARRAPGPTVEIQADYTLKDFSATRFDREGRPVRSIEGAEMIHFADASLATVHGLELDDLQRHWRASARKAVLVEGRDFIRLDGDVHFVGRPSSASPVHVYTDDLDIELADDLAETGGPVRIVQGRFVTRARGLRVTLADHRLRLLADVHSRYEPTRP